ncbi:MAG TPA: TetR/AcrR family transcriptional regulator [Pseudolysinimonas sp.]|nr:TetR/AcrR family transcriptional regulator [Pseudolysinimonas sp.]
MSQVPRAVQQRSTYRHGDLRQALLDAGVAMAREGGPDAVVLREATRRAGVSPNAAYRHFADREALVSAVSDTAAGASAAAIEAEWDAVPPGTPAETAHAHLRAVGRGYLRFARDEPGLFRAAYTVPTNLQQAFSPEKAGPGGRTPFQLLAIALDELVEAGVLPAERRPGAEFSAWSAVHGLAMLVLGGPLRDLDEATLEHAARSVIDMVDRGL